jgi:hypothetical protein
MDFFALVCHCLGATELVGLSPHGYRKLVYTGKYLVGKDVVPGTWQSQGDKVGNCQREISDAQGYILANNFISVAPQFTIIIPRQRRKIYGQGLWVPLDRWLAVTRVRSYEQPGVPRLLLGWIEFAP